MVEIFVNVKSYSEVSLYIIENETQTSEISNNDADDLALDTIASRNKNIFVAFGSDKKKYAIGDTVKERKMKLVLEGKIYVESGLLNSRMV